MKKTLIVILFVALFIGMVFIPAGASQIDDIQPRFFRRNKWVVAAITGGLLVEDFSYDKQFEKLNIFTNLEITGTVLEYDFTPLRSEFFIGSWARTTLNTGDRLTINASILFCPINNSITVGEEFWFSKNPFKFFLGECIGLNVKVKLQE